MNHPRVIVVNILKTLGIRRVVGKIYYKYFHGFNPAGKGLPEAVEKCFDKAKELKTVDCGDYLEFGIYKGFTFAFAFHYAQKLNLQKMRFFGFDSFQGLPKIEGLDIVKQMPFYKGQYSAEKEKVHRDIDKTNVDWNKSFLIEGFFDKSLNNETKNKYKLNKIAVCLIDCDLHSSTVEVLNFIKDMLMDSTILIFDDWNAFGDDNERGQRRAFRDFLSANKHFKSEEYFSYGAYGKVFILNVNNNF